MKKILIGTILGGIVLFVWQYAAWEFLGIHDMKQEPVLVDEAKVVEALAGNPRGVYWIPGIKQADRKEQGDAYKAWEKRHEAGPVAFLNYDPAGSTAMNGTTMAMGAAATLLSALMVVLLLSAAGIGSYMGRVLFVTGFGVFLALMMDVQGHVWMNHPMDWTKGNVLDHIAGMAIMGVVVSFIVKPAAA